MVARDRLKNHTLHTIQLYTLIIQLKCASILFHSIVDALNPQENTQAKISIYTLGIDIF